MSLDALAMGVLLFLLAFLSVRLTRPPAPVPATAPPGEVSAERAMRHVSQIAQRPHPVGSEDHARVRDYVRYSLEELGLETHVQHTMGMNAKYRMQGEVENVVGRLRGRSGSRAALMLAAHYDSVPAGPGAGDDASGVAAILEAVRALRSGPPLRNDLIVLLSDGEEVGLLGASAFMADDPWARDVEVAVNFDARGNAGVSSLFETSPGNAFLVGEAARAVPDLAGSSLAYEVYKRMPNDTDATVFKAHGVAALNFAFVGHWAAYHTADDDADHLDRGSLQQQADYAFGLARALGDDDLDTAGASAGPDAVFFTVPGAFVRYPRSVGLALAAGAALLALIAGWRGVRERRAPPRDVLAGLAIFFLTVVLAGGSGLAVASLAERLHGGVARSPAGGDVVESVPYAWLIVAIAAAAWLAVQAIARRWLTADALALGSALALVGLAGVTSLTLPGVGYLFVWPALGAGARLAMPARSRANGLVLGVASALPALAVVAPLVQGVFEGLGVTAAGGAFMGILVAILVAAVDFGARPPHLAPGRSVQE